jgi:hypothetical protein
MQTLAHSATAWLLWGGWTSALLQIDSGPRGALNQSLRWISRNPGEAAFYGALLALFIWAVVRFGKS